MSTSEETFTALFDSAWDAWEVVKVADLHDLYDPYSPILDPYSPILVRTVEAKSDTGSRYVVVATLLPDGADLGNTHLVTVLYPWQDAWTMQRGGVVHPGYVSAHFDRSAGVISPGDLAALTRTIAHALDSEAIK